MPGVFHMTSAALAAREARAWATLQDHPDLLLDVPHPDRRQALEGRKIRAYCVWLLSNAGVSGRTRACKWIEAALRRRQQPDLLRAQGLVAKQT